MISSSRDSTESNPYVKQEEDGMKRRCLSMLLAGFLTVSTVCQSVSGAEISTGEVEVQESYVQETEESVEELGEEEIADVQAEDAVVEESEEKDADVDEEEETDIPETVVDTESPEIDTEVQMETVLEQVTENTKAETEEAVEETEDIQEETEVEIQTETKTAARKMQKASIASTNSNEESPVERIEIEDVKIVENTYYYKDRKYNDDTGEYELVGYDYYHYDPIYTVYMKDGTILECDDYNHRGIRYDGKRYTPIYSDDQSNTNRWGVGKHVASASILGFDMSFTVEIVENPVERIEFEETKLIYGFDGYITSDYYDEKSHSPEYFYYRYEPEFKVILKDGTILESQEHDRVFDWESYSWYTYNEYDDHLFYGVVYEDGGYKFRYTDNQSYINQWKVGEKYTIPASILGFDTSFTVEIVETPVANVEYEDITLIEGIDGYIDGHGDETYFDYHYTPKYVVTLKDGTILQSNYYGSVYYNDKYYSAWEHDDQSYENQWGVGKHTVTIDGFGVKSSFIVEVLENPVQSVTCKDIKLIENADGWMSSDYNFETGEYDLQYYRYGYQPQYTVTLKDGTVVESDGGYFEYGNRSFVLKYSDDQSYSNQWGLGKHIVQATLLGIETSFTVEIVETPVEKVEFKEIKLIKNLDGDETREYNSESDDYDPYYYEYSYRPEYTITLKDGTVLEGSGMKGIEYNGGQYHLYYEDGQSYENQWDVGNKYNISASILGFDTSFTVEIIGIKSIEIKDVKLIENGDGYMTTWNPDTGKYDEEAYFHYWYNPEIVITLEDGTVFEGSESDGITTYHGNWHSLYSEDFGNKPIYSRQWKLGKNTVPANIFGVDISYTVELIESPVAKVEVEKFQCIKNTDGSNMNIEEPSEYFRYFYLPKYTVTLKDGTVLESTRVIGTGGHFGITDYIEYNGKWYWPTFSDEQSEINQWGVGEHTASISVIGSKPFSFSVEVIESPVEKVKIPDVRIIKDTSTSVCFYYDLLDVDITLKDGMHLSGIMNYGNVGDFIYRGIRYYFHIDDDQSDTNEWDVGKHIASTNILGVDTSFTVEILDASSVILRTDSNRITVTTTNAVLDSDTTLIADELSIEAKDIINNTAANMGIYDMDNAVLYDIYLEKEGQKIQPNGEVTVSIPVPGTMDAEKCSVLHIDDAGNVTDMHAVYENGYMVFTTNHFSYYALVEDASGVAVGGRITSYGAENGTVTVSLLDGEAEVERVETTDGTYAFSTVPSGTYTLRVSKANHVTRTYDMTVSDEAVTQDVKICLIGDVTGDGKVNTRDLNRVYAHVNGTNPLDGYEFTCGDVTGDGKINTRDLNRLYAHISETNLLW